MRKKRKKKIAEALYNFVVKFVHLKVDELYERSRKYKLDFEDAIHFYCSLKIPSHSIFKKDRLAIISFSYYVSFLEEIKVTIYLLCKFFSSLFVYCCSRNTYL